MRIRSPVSDLFGLIFACALSVGLSGCQKLFTTSLGESLARDGVSLPSNLDPDQAADLVEQARDNGDVELATELVGTLVDEIAHTTNPQKKQELEAAAAAAAVVASDATGPLTALINSYANGSTPSDQTLIDLALSIKNKASEDIVTACSYLDPNTGVSDSSAVKVKLSGTDYAIAAVIIMASLLPDGANPQEFDYDTAYPPMSAGAAKMETASSIIREAVAITDPDSPSYDLLQSISEKFHLMTP
jgi:hypothetical protein